MIAMVLPMFSAGVLPKAHAPTTGTQYFLTPVPVVTQEGYTIVLVLTVIGALPSTTYQFNFQTKDPSGKIWTSSLVTENTTASETSFSKLIRYPSPNFIGTNSLCCTYNAQANQIKPLLMTNVASTPFGMIITDRNPAQYQRTETVGIRASGYNASESVGITIRTFTTSTLVFSQTLPATAAGIVSTSWKVPKNGNNVILIPTILSRRITCKHRHRTANLSATDRDQHHLTSKLRQPLTVIHRDLQDIPRQSDRDMDSNDRCSCLR